MYLDDLRRLFRGAEPTRPRFRKAMSDLSPDEQQLWQEKLFITSFCGYNQLPKCYQHFLDVYIDSNREAYLDYIHRHTLLGRKRYRLRHPDMIRKMFTSLEVELRDHKSSVRHLSFCMLMVFDYNVTINTFCNQMRDDPPMPSDYWEWYEMAMMRPEF